jgi:hypothetical protein
LERGYTFIPLTPAVCIYLKWAVLHIYILDTSIVRVYSCFFTFIQFKLSVIAHPEVWNHYGWSRKGSLKICVKMEGGRRY